jgi:hypothetical protein
MKLNLVITRMIAYAATSERYKGKKERASEIEGEECREKRRAGGREGEREKESKISAGVRFMKIIV